MASRYNRINLDGKSQHTQGVVGATAIWPGMLVSRNPNTGEAVPHDGDVKKRQFIAINQTQSGEPVDKAAQTGDSITLDSAHPNRMFAALTKDAAKYDFGAGLKIVAGVFELAAADDIVRAYVDEKGYTSSAPTGNILLRVRIAN